ncbi:hypothetical protein GGS21DRAFT_538133 [Xylaria nigripes]|nr:hypothetical protein GGS21DRAFT_538133 [Xylaria nigripes]
MMNRGLVRLFPIQRSRSDRAPAREPELSDACGPTPGDCVEVKSILAKATLFPPEVVDIVMDFAEYWACSVASIDFSMTASGCREIYGSSANENQFILRTKPLGLTAWHSSDNDLLRKSAPALKLEKEYPREELERFVDGPPLALAHPFRKVVFDIVSRDQGWGSDSNSWTWFDAGIDRFDKGHVCSNRIANSSELTPTACAVRPIWPTLHENESKYNHELLPVANHKIQCNQLKQKDWQHHHVEWSWTDDVDPESSASQELDEIGRGSGTGDGSFVRNLKVGDMVTIWGRARFPGWTNRVQRAEIRVYWAL